MQFYPRLYFWLGSALVALTLAPAGGVDFNPPVRFFADSEKTAARSAAKFAIAIQPTI